MAPTRWSFGPDWWSAAGRRTFGVVFHKHGTMNRGGFSWRRWLGLSAAQARLSRPIGAPLSQSGRRQKLSRLVGRGCLVSFVIAGGAVWALL